jgi:hypothetical protein
MKAEELIEHLKIKGEEFEPDRFYREAKSYLDSLEIKVKEMKDRNQSPAFYSNRISAIRKLSQLAQLDSTGIAELGANLCLLEHYVSGKQDELFGGLAAQAAGYALKLDKKSPAPYLLIAGMANISSFLSIEEIRDIRIRALKLIEPTSDRRREILMDISPDEREKIIEELGEKV